MKPRPSTIYDPRSTGTRPMSTTSGWKNDAILLLVVLIWGINYPVIKTALAVMPAHVVNAFRFVVSAAVLGGIYAARQRSRPGDEGFFYPVRTHLWQIVGLGLLGHVVYQLCFIVGVDNTTAGNAALIMTSVPLWTALFSRALRVEVLPRKAWAGLTISVVGTVAVVVAGAGIVGLGAGSLYGNLLMTGAAVVWAGYTTFSKPLLDDLSPSGLTFFAILVALPLLWLIAIPSFDAVPWAEVDVWVWAAIVYAGGLSTGLAYGLWNLAVRNVGPSHAAAFNNLVPFVAIVGGVLLLGEPVTVFQLAGGALIIGGLVLLRRARRPRTRAAATAE